MLLHTALVLIKVLTSQQMQCDNGPVLMEDFVYSMHCQHENSLHLISTFHHISTYIL